MGIDALIDGVRAKQNPMAVGLDPYPESLPEPLMRDAIETHGETPAAAAAAVLRYNKELLDALHDIVPAVIPQLACYERLGPEGLAAMRDTIQYARSLGLYVIADAKRGDAGDAAACYSAAYLGRVRVGNAEFTPFDADALTVSPYIGSDGVTPFLEDIRTYDRALFIAGLTPNRSSRELQQLPAPDRPLYRAVAELTDHWGRSLVGQYGYSAVGLMLGTAQPRELLDLRRYLPRTFFLITGCGAQGVTAWDCARAFDDLGRGAVIHASRRILCAWRKSGGNFADAARNEALRMREELRKCIVCN